MFHKAIVCFFSLSPTAVHSLLSNHPFVLFVTYIEAEMVLRMTEVRSVPTKFALKESYQRELRYGVSVLIAMHGNE